MECGGFGVICTGIGLSCPWRESYTRRQAAGSSISHGQLSAWLADFFTSALSAWWDQSTPTTRPVIWLYCLLLLLLQWIPQSASLTTQIDQMTSEGHSEERSAFLHIKVHIRNPLLFPVLLLIISHTSS